MIDCTRSWIQIELIHESSRLLKEANITDSRRNVEWMLCELLKCTRAQLYAYPNKEVSGDVLFAFNSMVVRRAKCEPLQYILGYTEFFGIRVQVAPGVLIPRPETELLVEEVLGCLASMQSPAILDIGTGSGCIALALKNERPDATVHGCDVSTDALTIAQDNARQLDLDVRFFSCDIKESQIHQAPEQGYDLIVSNPPYIPRSEHPTIATEVKDFEPDSALFVDDDPLEYYRYVTLATRDALTERGFLCVETHMDFATDIAKYLDTQGLSEIRVINDLADRPRIVIAQKN
ncbi:MAG: peptide chain release factor N(5)-glutamine methyltransferase [Rhodothermaceae bacterium]|nr:peptide chain release factor N(5)-glutamine methyltransferase [Rhodothermaceae bacterium]